MRLLLSVRRSAHVVTGSRSISVASTLSTKNRYVKKYYLLWPKFCVVVAVVLLGTGYPKTNIWELYSTQWYNLTFWIYCFSYSVTKCLVFINVCFVLFCYMSVLSFIYAPATYPFSITVKGASHLKTCFSNRQKRWKRNKCILPEPITPGINGVF